jgi:16S rRNA (adenine1518-N6/adenine1519-N6)-dimethyltransferase
LLIDQAVADSIVAGAELPKGVNILEIGAGGGVLTGRLARIAGQLAAVEVDYKLAESLRDTAGKYKNVKVVRADAREVVREILFDGQPYHVVANLPYSIGTPLMVDLLESRYRPETLTLMLQLEVAERVCATPGDMGLLSVMVQSFAEARKLFVVPPNAFWPTPKVHSAVIRLNTNNARADDPLLKATVFLARLAFASRRKMLHNSLSGRLGLDMEEVRIVCRRAGIDSSIRPQELSLPSWERLADEFSAQGVFEHRLSK